MLTEVDTYTKEATLSYINWTQIYSIAEKEKVETSYKVHNGLPQNVPIGFITCGCILVKHDLNTKSEYKLIQQHIYSLALTKH